jgi:hypothetical protein
VGTQKDGDACGCHGGGNKHPINSADCCTRSNFETKQLLHHRSAHQKERTYVNVSYSDWFCCPHRSVRWNTGNLQRPHAPLRSNNNENPLVLFFKVRWVRSPLGALFVAGTPRGLGKKKAPHRLKGTLQDPGRRGK